MITDTQLKNPAIELDHPINLRDSSLLEDSSKLPQMRFLWNEDTAFNLSLTLIFSAIRLGSQGSNDKEKMRSALKAIMVNFLNFSDEEFTFMKRDGNIMADEAWEDN